MLQHISGNDLADEDVDVAGNEPPVSSYPSVQLDKETDNNDENNNDDEKNNNNNKEAISGTSSGN